MALELILNGASRNFPALESPCALSKLVMELGLKSDRIAVERNGDIVARATWNEILLLSGDRLELVHFVGGGR